MAALALAAMPATGADEKRAKMTLTLVETAPDSTFERWARIEPGMISEKGAEWTADYRWSAPPTTIGEEGFEMELEVAAETAASGQFAGGTRLGGTNFTFDPEMALAEVHLEGGEKDSETLNVEVVPRWGVAPDTIVELAVGAQWGPSVYYRYRVSYEALETGEAEANEDTGRLGAELDCPGSIEISHLPSLNCHIKITGWRHNTSDPVEVLLPEAGDSFGNHANGIQVTGAGTQDMTGMSEPYSWGLFVFACPGQLGAGANCYENAAVSGATSTPVIVRQKGRDDVLLSLDLDALPTSGAGHSDEALPVDGKIEAALDCPDTITISAEPGIACDIVLTNWRRDTTDPVYILLPDLRDSYGNHANGLQVQTAAQERVFGWETPHRWGLTVFACPGRAPDAGVNCFDYLTKPGPATIDIVVRQNGMADAVLTLSLNAVLPQ
ncbi:hypothetical protein sos41_19220 [Alphaproteobacteria bacterium SO-S41]|nr:hypothetical protein sos41_19220 [Alphaproteobacteria bacterium SO-S41]